MSSPFEKNFDQLLDEILTDYRNQFPEADSSQGSLIFIKSACLASAVWGIHKHQAWLGDQIFPDTASVANMEHAAWLRGVLRKAGESDADLLDRLLADLREPAAGGNKADYVAWAKQVANVAAAWSYPLGNGMGTVDVLVLANETLTGSEIPDQALLDEVHAYIAELMPAEMHSDDLRVLAPAVLEQDVSMTVSGDVDPAVVAASITAYMAAMIPGQVLYLPMLSAIAINDGAINAPVTSPAANVVPGDYQMIRPGVTDVTTA